MLSITGLVFLFFLTFLVQKILKIGRREPHLHPGPPTVPILGNLHIFPFSSAHLKFSEWAKQYGDIFSLKIGSSTVVVISGMEACAELMDKRSFATADRPIVPMAQKVTDNLSMAFVGHTDTWRTLRKAAHAILTPKAVQDHLPIQRAEATAVLYDFLTTPDRFFYHIGRYSNSVIMSVLFGKRCPRYETKEATAFYESQKLWNLCISPTAVPPLDLLPWLDYIPERWAWWKGLAQKTREKQRALYFGLLDEVEARMKRGEENGSYMEEIITRTEELGLDREMRGYLGGALLEGASETTTFFLRYLVMSLVLYPEVQRKAHEEVDRVIGQDRLPTLNDIKDLPYIQALIKEVFRYRPPAPIMQHAITSDEEFRGHIVPKGTTILASIYGIYHNPQHYDDPESFNPERYVANEHGVKEGVDTSIFRDNVMFGFGRRICPGMHLGRNSVNLNTINLIWGFNFKHAKDANGKEIPISFDDYDHEGIVAMPLPFKCDIRPRNQNIANLIEREFRESTETFEQFEIGLAPADKAWVDEVRGKL
ncbi:cytochrome p450 [Moniliophthora roreri MCA 2997]|uniref:Cytochrome p450 n=1 Tax=Moniliophthora roreri (strain MCA 2997) TaxID=1381753 RepID=V2WT83_MONRO|nr:cytochrome p450 [Moniliophthora roreri MCA 2997]KAI3605726.1 cytochrome p450 [Moniliophthora roreri]